ncbi:hypothetical protein SK3146_04723 [Paenibacillus konkukensis]|uniref:Uncharacterized protein n=1 Tax=Paenibacillus konkukensis TaxID=2020716 RepID=A0ABY4RSA3_9BACL|nr:hypothetical protein [Paenibacillus konkukensis]UQZ85434.1 hypothetical protein SK3146_04723 [Paenibacillus konkukensis]
MIQYLVMEVRNLEPLKIGAGGSKKNPAEPSKDYIPGSTLRGAIISQLIKQGVFTQETGPSIVKGIECYNAYPYRNDKLFVPTPQNLRVDKHKWRRRKLLSAQPGGEDSTISLSDLLQESRDRNALEYRFLSVEGDTLIGAKPPKFYTLHHSTSNKPSDREKENLFNYQAIASDQTFRSILSFGPDQLPLIESIIGQKQSFLAYLGGSKGSGYGLCMIKTVGEVQADYREARKLLGFKIPSKQAAGRKLTITCLSDCMFRDEYGRPINELPRRFIEQGCGVSGSLAHSLVVTGISEGFNTKWGARYPKETTLKAGSVLRYELERELSEAEWERVCWKLEHRLLGMRTQDGYGWVGINLEFPAALRVKEEQDQANSASGCNRETISVDESPREKEAAAQDIGIIKRGLKETKAQWLRMIVLKAFKHSANLQPAADRVILRDGLRRHPLQLMLEELRLCMAKLRGTDSNHKSSKSSSSVGDKQLYRFNKEVCSIADCSFAAIIDYLNGGGEEAANRRLEAYADKMLGSKRGGLYYAYANGPNDRPLFVAELLEAGLYYLHRRDS